MAETLLTEAPANTTEGADAETSLLDTKAEGTQDGTKTSPEGTEAEGSKTETKVEVAPEAKPVVPETYELKVPETMTLNPEFKAEFDTLAKSLGLSQENYQKLGDLQAKYTESQMKQTMDVFNKQIEDWAAETKKELGSDPAKSLAVASKAIDQIFTDPKENASFRDMMKTTGLGNWNLMVKAFTFVGKQLSEDKFVDGRSSVKERKSDAEVLFDHPTSVAAMKEAAAMKE